MTERIIWRGITIEVRHEPNWLGSGQHHLEIEANPRTPLPITETGYRSAFLRDDTLSKFESASAYVRHWLEVTGVDWDGQLRLL